MILPEKYKQIHTYIFDNQENIRESLLEFSKSFEEVCFLDSNNYQGYPLAEGSTLLGLGSNRKISAHSSCFEKLNSFLNESEGLVFGGLSYDLKNEVEDLESKNLDSIHFPLCFLFEAEIIVTFQGHTVEFYSCNPDLEINFEERKLREEKYQIELHPSINQEEYEEKVRQVHEHIIKGNVYEMNFCMEFKAKEEIRSPEMLFHQLNSREKTPFSAFVKYEGKYLLCCSPERFLKKEGLQLLSQPIKGTIRKGHTEEENKVLKSQLFHDEKERAENVMIVDLVRNDLARSSKQGSVEVPELFGIYPFKHVFQMISSVVSQVEGERSIESILRNAFPMGSMTGAPKVSAMQIIEELEISKRGLYSGSVGWFHPNGDFDLNVVIRSILYNSESKDISVQVGSAITIDSVPEKEYAECLVKIKGIREMLAGSKGTHYL